MLHRSLFAVVVIAMVMVWPAWLNAGDWPMSRHDAQRTNSTTEELSPKLRLQWVREEAVLKPAWPDQAKMQFDAVYDPIVVGKTLYLASPLTDSITAIDTDSGAERWRYVTDGPVRFAPLAWKEKLYCVSDDGFLHCLDTKLGRLLWKFRGAAVDRRVLGNERLISTWPARGAPVIVDGTLYFAAGIWPFMGIFIHALDAETGQVIWSNSGDGSLYMKQPHNADAFAAVAPQGHLTVVGDTLLIPGGRSVPALYDRRTGKMLRYQLAENGKRGGGSDVICWDKWFFNGDGLFEIESEKYLAPLGEHVVVADRLLVQWKGGKSVVYDLSKSSGRNKESRDTFNRGIKSTPWEYHEVGSLTTKDVTAQLVAGGTLFTASPGRLMAYPLPTAREQKVDPIWEVSVEGSIARLLAADGKLFAVSREGRLLCFGAQSEGAEKVHRLKQPPQVANDEWTVKARTILETTGVRDGYAVVWGLGDGRLAQELVRQSRLHVIVVDPKAEAVTKFRGQMVEAGLYGSRVVAHVGEPETFSLPPYLFNVMVNPPTESLPKLYQSLRPFGGVAVDLGGQLGRLSPRVELPGMKIRQVDGLTLVSREGPLPGSGNWTHEHADAANTRVSKDQLVKAPLGLLWFGGPTHDGVLPRHGHGPQPQVIDGRLIIEGVDQLRCQDIYSGRLLWQTRLPGVGSLYNNLAHQPGSNASGTNFISTSDGVYVAIGPQCVKLSLDDGKPVGEFKLPMGEGMKEAPLWGYINIQDNFLIGGSEPLFDPKSFKPVVDPKLGQDKDPNEPTPILDKTKTFLNAISSEAKDNYSVSKHLVVMDRSSGKVLWSATARHWFRHNAICVGGGRLYVIDRLPVSQLLKLKMKGEKPSPSRLLAFDLKTGQQLWSTETDVFGTWLSYSEKYDVLVEAGRVARDTISDEPKGMRAYGGQDGKVMWFHASYVGPAMIHGDMILKDQSACDLRTGKPTMRTDPITGEEVEWRWLRNYGCNTPAASEHLLTFRSGAAGYFDLCSDGGTGNFGGFRSGCTNNLVVAGGVLTAPDYTRTCTCSYQNQTSLALVPMSDAEEWTFVGSQQKHGPIARLGLNLGAPGDRRAADGTLWLEYPPSAGQSPNVAVKLVADNALYFRRHSSLLTGEMTWIGASGLKGVKSLTLPLVVAGPSEATEWHWVGQHLMPPPTGAVLPFAGLPLIEKPKPPVADRLFPRYTVRLYFAEPDGLKIGERLFHVKLQGEPVLKDFDIVKETKGENRTIVKEFRGVVSGKEIVIDFEAVKGVPVLCGVEMIAEK